MLSARGRRSLNLQENIFCQKANYDREINYNKKFA
jgi:hypothetical protein